MGFAPEGGVLKWIRVCPGVFIFGYGFVDSIKTHACIILNILRRVWLLSGQIRLGISISFGRRGMPFVILRKGLV